MDAQPSQLALRTKSLNLCRYLDKRRENEENQSYFSQILKISVINFRHYLIKMQH